MTAKIIPLPTRQPSATDTALNLLQQYLLIRLEKDQGNRIALMAAWQMDLTALQKSGVLKIPAQLSAEYRSLLD